MYVVEVTPLRRGMNRAALSYFSRTPYGRGALVTIPLRKQETQGIVLTCEEVSVAKTALRSATFSLRRMPQQEHATRLPETLLETADRLAEHHATSAGAVLFALLPTEVRAGSIQLSVPEATEYAPPHPGDHRYEVFQAPLESRQRAYVSVIRESFAGGHSVLIVAPTIEESERLRDALSTGIDEHVVLLNGNVGIRALRRGYASIARSPHALTIITTPQYAFPIRDDLGTLIIERSRAQGFRGARRPYLDTRHALSVYAACAGLRLITADTLIRTEDEYLLREGHAVAHEEHPKRVPLPGTLKTISMKDKPDGTVPFALFSPVLLDTLTRVRKARGRSFLFSARRGLAPVVACVDCGFILRCPESGSPLSLHRTVRDGIETRWLYSAVSGFRRQADDLCSNCGSWRLRERGIGIQHVYDELTAHVPKEDLFLFDHDTASTHKKACALRDAFYARTQGVMVGTAVALPYLSAPLDMSAVVSLDSLRAIPSWRQEEEALGILLTLREKTEGFVFAQSRTEADALIAHAQKGDTATFYEEELAARERFAYPPYSVFIHLSWQKAGAENLTEDITARFTAHDISVYAPPDAEDRIGYGLIRVPASAWPLDTLVDRLRALPPSVRIVINPDRLV